ncbi:MAG TPA: hypothetical protein VE990_08425 [Acidimicrobiales bacterium]|nr:hypothetical protein [Acidimicrobiales bacterium]
MTLTGGQLTVTVTTAGPAVVYVTPTAASPASSSQTLLSGQTSAVFHFTAEHLAAVKVDVYSHSDHGTCPAIPQ